MTDPRPAPYPADTRAKGWRFELDYEQIEQSDTWGAAKPEARPWLLMLWLTAWKQVPAGSLPDDDEVLIGKLGIPEETWTTHRRAILRGWWKADDGRLYHDTLAERVQEMMRRRRSDSDRQAANRAKKAAESHDGPEGVTRDMPVTPVGVGAESSTDNRIPTSSSSPASKKKARAAPAAQVERPADVDESVWRDWLALRKAKKAPVTPTVLENASTEAAAAGMSLEAFLRVWCARGSQGLQAEWLKPHERPQQPSAAIREPAWRAEQRQRTAEFAGPYAAKATPAQPPHEEHHGLAISVD